MVSPDAILGAVGLASAGLLGWGISVERRLASHDAVVERLDKLITILLGEHLDKGQEWRDPSPYRSGRGRSERGGEA